MDNHLSRSSPWHLRLGAPFNRSLKDHFDPHLINTDSEAMIARSLYSPLFQVDENGQFIPAVASDFKWDGDAYSFEFRPDLKTSAGKTIGAKDAYWSLIRILKKNKNTHGDIWDFVCIPGEEDRASTLEQVAKACPGVWVEGDILKIRPNDPNTKSFLVPLLANVDFAVLPYDSVDWGSPNLDMINFSQTSGPYYLKVDDPKGLLVFEANPNNFLLKKDSPKQVAIIPITADNAVEKLASGEIDAITGNVLRSREALDQVGSVRVEESAPFKLYQLAFTPMGRSKFTSKQRLYAGNEIRKALIRHFNPSPQMQTREFFPTLSEGTLNAEQKTELAELFLNLKPQDISGRMVFGAAPSQVEMFQLIFKKIPFVEVRSYASPPWTLPKAQQPDCYFNHTDSTFYESLSLLNYNFSTESFGPKDQGKSWIRKYIATEDKGKRLAMLQDLHLNFLREGYLIPIFFSPYYSAARAGVSLNQFKYYAGFRVWNLKRD